MRFGSLTLAAQILSTLMTTRLEILFLEWSWGTTAVGLFTVSLTLANMACVPMFLCTALLPHLSSLVGEDALERTRETYRYSLRLLALIVLPGCLGLAAITPVLLPSIYGPAFRDAVPSAMLLITFSACITLSTVPMTFLLAREQGRLVITVSAIGAAITILSGLTLIPLFGTIGGAVGRALMHAVVFAIALHLLVARLGCRPPIGDLVRILLAAITCGTVALAVVWWWQSWAGIILAIVVGLMIYGVALRLFGALKGPDADRIRRSLSLLPGLLQHPSEILLGHLSVSTETKRG
jgi:O-antigen/teichoic acid export membrane protein